MNTASVPTSPVPRTQPTDDELSFDQSISFTPKPQASSTVNRRPLESESYTPKLKFDAVPKVESPSYLLNAIAGMRRLTDQLGILHEISEDTVRMPPPVAKQLRKAVSTSEICDSRRESVLTESEANSSLGILKLDSYQGFSEAENEDKVAEIFSNFREEYLSKSLHDKENSNPLSSSRNISRLSMNHQKNDSVGGQAECDTSSRVLNSESSLKRKSIEADLRLRLQRELAQRTIDRSSGSFRMSQLGDSCNVDDLSISDHASVNLPPQTVNDATFLSALQTPSSASNTTFGAANFLSFSSPPVVTDSLSSENFQPADLAFDRLNQDENSWRQHFDDFPVTAAVADVDKASKSFANQSANLTQNLNFSTFSGIVGGDVTLSSSITEDFGKRRLSVGEYFQLRTECLGRVSEGHSDDERPNFGHSIRSPPKRRPHPPLVNISSSQGFLDDVPTRDAGLNTTLNSSFSDAFNFSSSVHSNVVPESALNQDEDTSSRSVDLMPPPLLPPKAFRGNSRNLTSSQRESMSSRLSMSLSMPKDVDETKCKDLNSSSLSLDSGEKLLSISQIVNLMNDETSGKKSARQLVDDFMRYQLLSSDDPSSKPTISSTKSKSLQIGAELNHDSLKKNGNISSECSPSRNQRVKAWISSINNSECDLNLDNNDNQKNANSIRVSEISSNGSHRSKASSNLNKRGDLKHEIEGDGLNFVCEKRDSLLNAPADGDESVTSFMPPPGKQMTPALSKPRLYSTPKGPEKHKVLNIEKMEGNCEAQNNGNSQDSDSQSVKSQESLSHSSNSKPSSWNSSKTRKSVHQRSNSQYSDSDCKTQIPDWKYNRTAVVTGNDRGSGSLNIAQSRPPSTCGSATSSAKSSSRQTCPLQIESTHTQLSWASVSPGSSVSQTFALRNKASARVRLVVGSPNSAYKLMGEHGEVLSELMLTLHSEETRRIRVIFAPTSCGPIFGKIVISRVATSEGSLSSSEDRRLIALYGYGGIADLTVEGASKDLWAQLFLNMCTVDSDGYRDVSDPSIITDSLQMIATFSVRNNGRVPSFLSLQVAAELPFSKCGVYVSPNVVSLSPGEVGQVEVRFDPDQDVLQWLSKNAADMQLLANIWISWSELATWQRIRRIFLKYYKSEVAGPLSTWGPIYDGDLGVGQELKDNKSSEAVLAQSVRRLKVAVLIERDRLGLFDLDSTMVFDQLVANETAMFESPQWNEKTLDTTGNHESPPHAGVSNLGLSENLNEISESKSNIAEGKKDLWENNISPVTTIISKSLPRSRNLADVNLSNDLVFNTKASHPKPQVLSLEFPPTTLRHKSRVNITLQNPSSERDLVFLSDLSPPFTVSTPTFSIPPNSYFTMSIVFKPSELGVHHSTLNVFVNERLVRSYLIKGEGVF